ncbi:hypothetical protein [Microbulbifer sp. SAOS-129_SWC]|uniref:hypothetical protein n=1 Tax=Microbulbifer sp. SAOS-129_SWC TaxID=3145235 RepID=UPI0032175F98
MKNLFDTFARSRRARRLVGFGGLLLVLPIVLWLPLGWLGLVPTMVAVFGVSGLRLPAGIVVAGLLIAAVGFWDYDRDSV